MEGCGAARRNAIPQPLPRLRDHHDLPGHALVPPKTQGGGLAGVQDHRRHLHGTVRRRARVLAAVHDLVALRRPPEGVEGPRGRRVDHGGRERAAGVVVLQDRGQVRAPPDAALRPAVQGRGCRSSDSLLRPNGLSQRWLPVLKPCRCLSVGGRPDLKTAGSRIWRRTLTPSSPALLPGHRPRGWRAFIGPLEPLLVAAPHPALRICARPCATSAPPIPVRCVRV
mmetsp:Transcript_24183/g.91275  ORF Transcript_24183/g.91275 Transcript_24183/m.91275 type:complete len:225 (+) Transcript_24183:521-1195(+)